MTPKTRWSVGEAATVVSIVPVNPVVPSSSRSSRLTRCHRLVFLFYLCQGGGAFLLLPDPFLEGFALNLLLPPATPDPIICASMLSCDLSNLETEARQMVDFCGADWLHMDVSDGHFAPNQSFSATVIESLKSSLPDD